MGAAGQDRGDALLPLDEKDIFPVSQTDAEKLNLLELLCKQKSLPEKTCEAAEAQKIKDFSYDLAKYLYSSKETNQSLSQKLGKTKELQNLEKNFRPDETAKLVRGLNHAFEDRRFVGTFVARERFFRAEPNSDGTISILLQDFPGKNPGVIETSRQIARLELKKQP